MRFKGVRVDKERSEALGDKLKSKQANIVKGIKRKTGVDVSIWAADHKRIIRSQKIADYKITEKTKRPMLSKQWLESHQ